MLLRTSDVATLNCRNSPQLTGIIWTVLDERRELCKNVCSHVKGLFIQWADVRIPAAKTGESSGQRVKKLVSKNKPSSQWLFINGLIHNRTWEEPAPVPETPRF